MTMQRDTGYSINAYNFNLVTEYIISLGDTYQTPNTNIQPPALIDINNRLQAAIRDFDNAQALYNNAQGDRLAAYKPLKTLPLRILHFAESLDISQRQINHIKFYVYKIMGRRISPKLSQKVIEDLANQGTHVKQISAAQTSFGMRYSNFNSLLTYLEGIPEYTPFENDLKYENLIQIAQNIEEKNDNIERANIKIRGTRHLRMSLIYRHPNGIVHLMVLVRNYIESAFGKNSNEYKQICRYKFKKVKL